eukprot:TRINITY_DN401_c0_g1_i1.p1 TRINITY_DN401_c0_g1~~TRINITY_DN401_c0_g1_i1.p1  ORF type:complete len:254 (+),score=64.65 TRINITY_DN401_c0_g1_i1:127-888(+)
MEALGDDYDPIEDLERNWRQSFQQKIGDFDESRWRSDDLEDDEDDDVSRWEMEANLREVEEFAPECIVGLRRQYKCENLYPGSPICNILRFKNMICMFRPFFPKRVAFIEKCAYEDPAARGCLETLQAMHRDFVALDPAKFRVNDEEKEEEERARIAEEDRQERFRKRHELREKGLLREEDEGQVAPWLESWARDLGIWIDDEEEEEAEKKNLDPLRYLDPNSPNRLDVDIEEPPSRRRRNRPKQTRSMQEVD